MRQRMMNFMRGRYGVDRFSNFLMLAACAVVFINIFVKNSFLSLIGMLIFIYAYARIFSRNIVRRSDENTWFLNKTYGMRRYFNKKKSYVRIRRTHHIYRCPECRQRVKVPRGRGKIEITCPKCSRRFVKRS